MAVERVSLQAVCLDTSEAVWMDCSSVVQRAFEQVAHSESSTAAKMDSPEVAPMAFRMVVMWAKKKGVYLEA